MLDIKQAVEKPRLKEKVPNFNVGDTVRVSIKVKEAGKEKTYPFQGTVIKRRGGGIRETFTVRKESHGIGVERIFPLHSPIISEIRVLKKGKVRRAKLYYMRDKKK
jgi:large subunit ribosomal protein L19